VHDKAAVKGFDYEHIVLTKLTPIVTPHEDVPEHVGNEDRRRRNEGRRHRRHDQPGRDTRTHRPLRRRGEGKAMTLKKSLDELESAMRKPQRRRRRDGLRRRGRVPVH
jgi:hypothetical protein